MTCKTEAYDMIFDSGEVLTILYNGEKYLIIYEDERLLRWWVTPGDYLLGDVVISLKEDGTGELGAVGNNS